MTTTLSPVIPSSGPTSRTLLENSQRIFCTPQPYIIGATVGAAICLFTGITNPIAGAFMGAPVLPITEFFDQYAAGLGNTLMAKIARWGLAFFTSLTVGTLFTALCGLHITLAHGALLFLTLLVTAIALVSLTIHS
ncbi:MAG: hypothetical protein ACHQT8_04440 [Chlamydiales bacterium]